MTRTVEARLVATPAERVLLAVVALAALTSPWNAVRLGGWPVGDLVLVVAVPLIVLRSAVGRPALRLLRWWMLVPSLVCAALLGGHVVLAGGSLQETVAFGQGVAPGLFAIRVVLSTACVACCAVFAATVGGRPAATAVLGWWYLGVVISAGVAILQTLGVWSAPVELDQTLGLTPGAERQAGLASHPNSLGQSLALAIPVGVALACLARRPHRLLPVLGLLIVLGGQFTTGSRAGLIVTALAVLIAAMWLLWRSGRAVLILPVGALLVIAGIFAGPLIVEATRFGAVGSRASDLGRLAALRAGWEHFLASPLFGSGLGVWFGEAVPVILLASGGVVLLAGYLVFLGVPFVGFLREPAAPSALLGAAAVLVTLSFWLLNNGLLERVVFWPMLLAAAMQLATGSVAGAERPNAIATAPHSLRGDGDG